jgi:hypothetical protein
MKEQIKLFLNWSIPILCIANIILAWGDPALALAWLVATTGWASNLINYYKKES